MQGSSGTDWEGEIKDFLKERGEVKKGELF